MTAPRLRIAARAVASEAVLTFIVEALRSVPTAAPPLPEAIEDAAELWKLLNVTDPPPFRMSGFKATMAVVRRDNRRKLLDQFGDTAGRGAVPAGFESLDLVCGDAAPMHSYVRRPSRAGAPIVLMLHGMYDSKQSRYMHVTAASLAASGLGIAIPDQRWHGELFSDAYKPTFGIREAADAAAWGRALRDRFPASPLLLFGFSLGALYVINTMSRDPDRLFTGGIAVSPPAALAEVIPHLNQPPGFLRHPLLAFIRQFFHEALTIRMKSAGLRPDKRRLFSQFVEWLDDETKALRPDARSLVETAEPSMQLERIAAPLLIIGARDDTVFPSVALDSLARAAKSQPLVHVQETQRGGHIGIGAAYPEWFAPLCARFAWLATRLR
ncbi:MAG: alpha/beta hydrolase [Acidobacteria bacterium]|nr:alpha/beta hydrolase [Acidobacteriota bacterium]